MGSTGATISMRKYTYLQPNGARHSIFYPPPQMRPSLSPKLSVESYSGNYHMAPRPSLGFDEKIQSFKEIENLARGVKWDECPLRDGDGDTECDDKSSSANLTFSQKAFKFIKILLPHIGLNVLLLSYITFGALVFMWLEGDQELEERRTKLKDILTLYHKIINETISICHGPNQLSSINQTNVKLRLLPLLTDLSLTHEYDTRYTEDNQLWTNSDQNMVTRWSFASATLYALTVVTSTGYDHVSPNTDQGRMFTIMFGLVGIPLMFITAADIGRFLSEIVIRSYGKFLELCLWIASVLDSIKDYLIEDEDDDSLRSLKLAKKKKKASEEDDEDEDEDNRPQLPIASYFALIVGYCAIGSFIFNTFEKGSVWSFIHGLFFSFNLITTIGLGGIYCTSRLYLAVVVVYVIIGLAVITASLDLCSSTLKRTFTKLHYFGRKIRGARRGIANMSDDIREAMRIIAALKKTRPSKDRITLEDLRRFLEVQEQLLRQPFVPGNVHIFKWIEDTVSSGEKQGGHLIKPLQYFQYLDENGWMGEKKEQLGMMGKGAVQSSEQILLI